MLVDGHKLYFLSEIVLWEIDKRFCLESYSLKEKTMPKNEFICKCGVCATLGLTVIKIHKLTQLIMTMLIWFLSSCFFSSKKVPQCGIFIVRKENFSITGTIFSHSGTEHNLIKTQETFLLFEEIRTKVLIVLNFGSCPIKTMNYLKLRRK